MGAPRQQPQPRKEAAGRGATGKTAKARGRRGRARRAKVAPARATTTAATAPVEPAETPSRSPMVEQRQDAHEDDTGVARIFSFFGEARETRAI